MVISVPGVIEKKGAVAAFDISLLVTGFGTGGLKANISPLVAEQYKRNPASASSLIPF
jgi:POT family proton-dependent oligopeptide transporter